MPIANHCGRASPCVQGVSFDGNVVHGEPAGDRVVGVSSATPQVFASPQRQVWQWPGGPTTVTASASSGTAKTLQNRVQRAVAAMRTAKKVCTSRTTTRATRTFRSLPVYTLEWHMHTRSTLQCAVIGPDLIQQIRVYLSNFQMWYPSNS